MTSPRILIVDDEESICFVLQRALRNEGYILETAVNGQDAIDKLHQHSYDVMLLDLHMEPVNGMTVFAAARELDENIMVIILTAHGSLETSIEALRHGAFDYLFKPASPDVIRRRVRKCLEKRQQLRKREQILNQIESLRHLLDTMEDEPLIQNETADQQRFIHSKPLVIDTYYQAVTFSDNVLELTTTEYNLLLCLVKNSPHPVSPRQLVQEAMGYDSEDHEAREIVKFHIYQLRQKLEPIPQKPKHIKTMRYKGYLWHGE